MIDSVINMLNRAGDSFCGFALLMLIQSSVLILALYLIDLAIRKRVRAVFRHCIWMLVFIKLVLPPTLCLPTGIGYWCGIEIPSERISIRPETAISIAAEPGEAAAIPYDLQDRASAGEATHIEPRNAPPRNCLG